MEEQLIQIKKEDERIPHKDDREMIESDLTKTMNSKNGIVRWYFRRKFKKAMDLAKLNKDDVILDFGSGGGYLKNSTNGLNIINYDINPKFSEVGDYREVKPNKIIAIDVFEHIEKEELKNVLNNFKKMSDNFVMVVNIPNENLLSRKVRLLLGKPERVKDHITSKEEILKILKKEFDNIEIFGFMGVSTIIKIKR